MAKKYEAIQILRFVAATFVVIDHAISTVIQNWSNAPQLSPIAWSFGEAGVIVFFGISGFIMASTQYESFGSTDKSIDFLLRRIIRIVPIYAIATTIEYIHKMHAGADYNFLNYIRSLLFIPYIGEGGLYRPILGQGWTLNYEMFFYLVFAVSLSLSRPMGFLLSIAGFTLLAALSGTVTVNNVTATFYLNHILLYFICGMVVAVVKKHHDRTTDKLLSPMLLLMLLMVITAALNVILKEPYFLLASLISVFICVYACASCVPTRSNKIQAALERLGDASYSTYLFHGFSLGAIRFLSNRIGNSEYTIAIIFVIFSILVANFAGLVIFTFVELPISRFLKRHDRVLLRTSTPR